jgi:hypothetical protein
VYTADFELVEDVILGNSVENKGMIYWMRTQRPIFDYLVFLLEEVICMEYAIRRGDSTQPYRKRFRNSFEKFIVTPIEDSL